MERNFRKLTLIKLIKEAGLVTDLVKKQLGKDLPNDKEKPVIPFKVLGSVGPGTSVLMPPNPVKPDGTVDIIIQIRGLSAGDAKTISTLGKNAVFITSEAGGKGSKENFQAYGNPGFVNQAVGTVLNFLKKQNPDKNISLGKLTISSFSGGGSATANLLANRNQLPKGKEPPKFVFIDGLHTDPNSDTMKAIIDFGQKAAKTPQAGELEIIYTAVIPKGYNSTTQVADHILGSLGLQRQPVSQWQQGKGPVSQAVQGGVKIIQLYDKPEPYKVKDPETGELKANIPGTAGYQHINALKWKLQNF